MRTRKPRFNLGDVINEIDEIFIPLKKLHSGNVQQNVDDVVILAISSSRSDPIQCLKWRRLREMHTCSTPMTPPPRSSEIWWSGRWDRQHDDVTSMVESMHRQGFACLRSRRRTEKGGYRNWAAAPRKLDHTGPSVLSLFIGARRGLLGVHAKASVPCRARQAAATAR
jgi:hypothetical protein